MEKTEGNCELCGGNYALSGKKEMSGTQYKLLKCEKCHHQVYRRAE